MSELPKWVRTNNYCTHLGKLAQIGTITHNLQGSAFCWITYRCKPGYGEIRGVNSILLKPIIGKMDKILILEPAASWATWAIHNEDGETMLSGYVSDDGRYSININRLWPRMGLTHHKYYTEDEILTAVSRSV